MTDTHDSRLAIQVGASPKLRRAVLVSCTTAGSLGDQAMIDAATTYLSDHGYEVTIVPNPYATRRACKGRTFGGPVGKVAGSVAAVMRADFVGFIGADVLDGVYYPAGVLKRLRLVRIGHLCGARTRVFGSSFSTTPSRQVIDHLRKAKWLEILARDGLSADRMEAALGRPPRRVADLAFGLEAEITSGAARLAVDWAGAKRRDGHILLGVNFGGPTVRAGGAEFTAGMAAALTRWLDADPNRSIVLVPHDFRTGHYGDLGRLRKVRATIPKQFGDRLHLVESPIEAWDAKALAGKVDAVLTSRMHFAIAALGMHVPPLCLVYQGKFEGLMRHFDLQDQTLTPDICRDPAALHEAIDRMLAERAELSKRIAARLPEVQALSRANFDGLP